MIMISDGSGLGQLKARAVMAECLWFTGTMWDVVAEYRCWYSADRCKTRSGEWYGEGSDRIKGIQCK